MSGFGISRAYQQVAGAVAIGGEADIGRLFEIGRS